MTHLRTLIGIAACASALLACGPVHARITSSQAAQSAGDASLDEKYRAAIVAGARPDVAKAKRLAWNGHRGPFRLRFGANQYLSHDSRDITRFVLTVPSEPGQTDRTLWIAEPGPVGMLYTWVRVPKADVFWSIRSPLGPLLHGFTEVGPKDRDSNEQFSFHLTSRDKAFVKIADPYGPEQGYLRYADGSFFADASSKAASLFIVE